MDFDFPKVLYTLSLKLNMGTAGNKHLITYQPQCLRNPGYLSLSFLEKKGVLVGFPFSFFYNSLVNRARCWHSIYMIGHLLSQSQVYALSISRKFG